MRVSRKGKAPSSLGSSMVNWMCGSWELICSRNWRLCSAHWMTNVSFMYLSHRWGWGPELMALTSNSSINRLAMRRLMGEPIAAPWTCSLCMMGVCGRLEWCVYCVELSACKMTGYVLLIHNSNCLCFIICDSYVPVVNFVLS